MPEFHTVHRVSHSAADMYALVADVQRYPEFVPLCSALTVRDRKAGEGNAEILIADMTVAYRMLHETFTSSVTLDPGRYRVDVEHVAGPFRHLVNRWRFTDVSPGHCEVDFYVSYEFASRTLQLLAGSVFDRAFRKFVGAFEARADEIHGTGNGAGAVTASLSNE